MSFSQAIGRSFSQSVGWFVEQFIGLSVSWLVGRSFGQSVSHSLCLSISWSVCQSVSQSIKKKKKKRKSWVRFIKGVYNYVLVARVISKWFSWNNITLTGKHNQQIYIIKRWYWFLFEGIKRQFSLKKKKKISPSSGQVVISQSVGHPVGQSVNQSTSKLLHLEQFWQYVPPPPLSK